MDVKPSRARGRPSTGAREAVVEAAHALFLERDYDEVSTEEILARSGVSRGAMYHHFPTKLDLFETVYEESERRVLGLVAAELGAARDPFEALLLGARAYLRQAETNPELRRIGLGQSRAVLGWSRWREVASSLGLGVVREMVRAAIAAGQISPRDPETTAQILLGALIEAAMLVSVAADSRAARESSEAVVVELIEGLRAG